MHMKKIKNITIKIIAITLLIMQIVPIMLTNQITEVFAQENKGLISRDNNEMYICDNKAIIPEELKNILAISSSKDASNNNKETIKNNINNQINKNKISILVQIGN